jgi:hypothetical protein
MKQWLDINIQDDNCVFSQHQDWTRMERKRCYDDECCDDPVNCQLRDRRTSSSAWRKTKTAKTYQNHHGQARPVNYFCHPQTLHPISHVGVVTNTIAMERARDKLESCTPWFSCPLPYGTCWKNKCQDASNVGRFEW